MKKQLFEGVGCAVVTPFKSGKIDYTSFERIIEYQIESGSDAIVVCGTTGESATLSLEEKQELFRFTVKITDGRIPVIAGCGANSTEVACKLSKIAENEGTDGILSVTPYYNKTSDEGLIKHYSAISDAVNLPIILYDVPSRTGMKINHAAYSVLAENEKIIGVKEASSDVSHYTDTVMKFGNKLSFYSGCDDLFLTHLVLGAKGIISVTANALPYKMKKIWSLFSADKISEARKEYFSVLPFIKMLFCEVNPIPIKTACEIFGLCSSEMRLPLCNMSEKNKERMKKEIERIKSGESAIL